MSLAGELVVLGTEENSSMVSTWKEFVCLQRLSDARFESSKRQATDYCWKRCRLYVDTTPAAYALSVCEPE